jgi:hypothetical protein
MLPARKRRACETAHLQQKRTRGGSEVTFRPRNSYALAVLLALAVSASAADLQYATTLDPVAFDNSTVKNTVGSGTVTGTLSGNTLTVSGTYSGLSSDATAAHLLLGQGYGVSGGPTGGISGAAIGDFAVSGGTNGQISGSLKLTSAQAKALGQGAVYLLVTSTKAPQGNLWGWLHLPDSN